jgi:hypothetical protein
MTSLSDHGIHLKREVPGTHRLPCPACNKGRHDDALAVTVKPDGLALWLCYRCGFKGALRPHEEPRRASRGIPRLSLRHPEPERRWVGLSCAARRLWRDCRPLTIGSPAAAYFRTRGCTLPEHDVRWHPALRHGPSGHVGPALVALVTDAVTAEPISLHMTWLAPDGSGKAAIDRPRLLMKGHRKAGGVVRLWPDEAVTYGLCVAEGIETALSAALGFGLAWACLDAGNLKTLPVLPGVEALTIVADHDRAGLAATQECARRWAAAGCEVRVWRAPEPGADFNDFAQGAAA